MFKKLMELSPAVWATLLSVVLIALVVFFVARSKRRWTANMLVTAAMCLALSFVLSYIRLYKMPQGGSITPASMLPVMMFAYLFGVIPGLVVGMAYGLLQMMQELTFIHPVQLMLDYFLPFIALALCGLFRNRPGKLSLPLGIFIAITTRVLMHTISGAIFFKEYAGDMNPWIYSILYNLSSVGLDGVICLVICLLPPVSDFINKLRSKQSSYMSIHS